MSALLGGYFEHLPPTPAPAPYEAPREPKPRKRGRPRRPDLVALPSAPGEVPPKRKPSRGIKWLMSLPDARRRVLTSGEDREVIAFILAVLSGEKLVYCVANSLGKHAYTRVKRRCARAICRLYERTCLTKRHLNERGVP